MNIKIGEMVRVINNQACHNIPHGTVLTVRQIEDKQNTFNTTRIFVKENGCFFYENDLEKIYKPNKKTGKIIITDPKFIIDSNEYSKIQYNHEKFKEPDFEHLIFPYNFTSKTGEPIIIHYIESTPYGKGEYIDEEFQQINTNSGLMCIAEKKTNWSEERGAIFDKLQIAKDVFQNILNKF